MPQMCSLLTTALLILVVPLLTAVLLLLLIIRCPKVPASVQYHCKFTLFVLVSLIWASVPIPLMLLRPRDSRNALMPAWGLRQCAAWLGLSFKVRGLENIIPGDRSGCIVLINHQSALDLIVLAHLWPILPRCTVISKREVFWLWPFGLATWLWGTVFIDRRDGGSARAAVNAAGNAVRGSGSRVLMFPEGTRHGGSDLLPFKKGAFHIAVEAQCPIQPVVVSQYRFLDARKRHFGTGESIISILPPVVTEGLNRDGLPELVERVRDVMCQEYQTLNSSTLMPSLNNNTHEHIVKQ